MKVEQFNNIVKFTNKTKYGVCCADHGVLLGPDSQICIVRHINGSWTEVTGGTMSENFINRLKKLRSTDEDNEDAQEMRNIIKEWVDIIYQQRLDMVEQKDATTEGSRPQGILMHPDLFEYDDSIQFSNDDD